MSTENSLHASKLIKAYESSCDEIKYYSSIKLEDFNSDAYAFKWKRKPNKNMFLNLREWQKRWCMVLMLN